jgi:hypothetical protein
MRMRLFVGLVIAALAAQFATLAAAQQMYRWTDENGRTHITDTPPPAAAKGVRKVKPPAGPAESVPYSLQQAMKNFPVTLYTSAECVQPCAMAREHLGKRGVPFSEVQIRDGVEELKRLAAGAGEVPALKVGGSVVSGFAPQAYDGALDSAGYPRLALRARPAPSAEKSEAAPRPEAATPEAATPEGPYAPRARPQSK